MNIQPSIDLKKVNLQTAVGYLVSLHENEYQWNLLGIKVVGTQEALPIPEGTYEYGDAYMIGNETDGYTMYIWTRADSGVHKEDYWFPIGQFPKPGPQGPRGDGVETFRNISTGAPTYVTYDTTNGISTSFDAQIDYEDNETIMTKSQTVSLITKTPILPGQYISINTTPDNKAVEVKVDDATLQQDYFKIDKSVSDVNAPYVPSYNPTTADKTPIRTSPSNIPNTICYRDANGNCDFNKIYLSNNGLIISNTVFDQTLMVYGLKEDLVITDQTGGTLTASEAYIIKQIAACRIKIQNNVYHRVSPLGRVPAIFMSCGTDGTIYVLTCDTSAKTYTISTLASQATGIYRHGIVMYGSIFNIYIDIYDSNSATYTYSALKTKLATDPSYTAVAHISGEGETHISAALVHYNTSLDNYTIMYHNKQNLTEQVNWTPTQVVDNGTPIYNA